MVVRRQISRETQFRFNAAENADQFILDDLDHLLGRGKRCQDFLAQSFPADVLNQLFDDLEVDIGLEQSHADLLQSLLDILLGELSLPAQVFEDTLEFLCKAFKHVRLAVRTPRRKPRVNVSERPAARLNLSALARQTCQTAGSSGLGEERKQTVPTAFSYSTGGLQEASIRYGAGLGGSAGRKRAETGPGTRWSRGSQPAANDQPGQRQAT